MKFTLNWLKEHINIKTDITIDEISKTLNSIGLELEKVENLQEIYQSFIVVKINEVTKHPYADSLNVCQVYDGSKTWQIVCGANNVKVNMLAVMASINSIIPTNKMKIKESKIRGIKSQGMLCSAEELQLTNYFLTQDQDGIIDLPQNFVSEIGNSITEVKELKLKDVFFEVGLTPNRRLDAASVMGVARDLSAADLGTFKHHDKDDVAHLNLKNTLNKKPTNITNQSDYCKEIRMIAIDDIKQNIASEKMAIIKSRMTSIDQDCVNHLVAISNYAMFDLGRPNHIYDYDTIKGDIDVRLSLKGEKFVAINGNSYILPKGILVIADQEKILSIAGIIGGESSKVTDKTKNILVEIAIFDSSIIAKAGRILNIQSDARYRFEGGVDQGISDKFESYLVDLIVNSCGGIVTSRHIIDNRNLTDKKVLLNLDYVNSFVGYKIKQDLALSILQKLGFKVTLISEQKWQISVPTWRLDDINSEEDIIEEIMRIIGMNYLPSFTMSNEIVINNNLNLIDKIKNTLIARNINEIITWSFFSKKDAKFFSNENKIIRISNPITEEMSIMRTSMIANHLKAALANINRRKKDICFFEYGKIYDLSSNGYSNEMEVISGLRIGHVETNNLHNSMRKWDVFDVKADLIAVITCFNMSNNIENYKITSDYLPSYYHPTQSASVLLGNKLLGYFGSIHPQILKEYNCKNEVMIFEVLLNNIPLKERKYSSFSFSKYQAIERDLSFIIADNIDAIAIVRVAKKVKSKELKDVEIFDIYQQKEAKEKSISLKLSIQSDNGTMREEEINYIVDEVVTNILIKFGAKLKDGK